jgi:hypothetical protein
LAGTAGVFAVMGLLAIPLHRLTSQSPTPPPAPANQTEPAATAATPCLLRLKLIAPAKSIRIATQDDDTALVLTDVPAGESEHDVSLPVVEDSLDLILHADLGSATGDTALFLTVMPDGMEPLTRYAIGSGELTEAWHFDWGSGDRR